jgi:hypothetical protein
MYRFLLSKTTSVGRCLWLLPYAGVFNAGFLHKDNQQHGVYQAQGTLYGKTL